MMRIATWLLMAALAAPAWAAIGPDGPPTLSAAEIVAKNVAARGGVEAWHGIKTMVWVGHVQSSDGATNDLPFLFELKRPNKTRFEVKSQGMRSVRGFDGARGWKLRAGRNGQPEVQPYSDEELKFAREADGIDAPLIDAEARGIVVVLEGSDEVDGRKAYRLKLTWPSGTGRHVWIDAASFLDVMYDRQSRDPSGRVRTVTVHNRDFRAVEGVQLPMTIETSMDAAQRGDRMVIDRVALNPAVEDRQFAKPVVPHLRRGVSVDIPPPRSAGLPFRRGQGVAPAAAPMPPGAAGASRP